MDVQTPLDPVQAALQAQAQLNALAAQQMEAQRQRQAAMAQSRQNVVNASIVGSKAMDAVTGSSPAVQAATPATQAAYGGNALAPISEAAPAPMGGVGLGGIAAGGYTGYQQAKGVQAAAQGKNLSTQQQAALALPTFGTSFLVNPVRSLWDKNAWQTEGKRIAAAKKSGTEIPDSLSGATQLTGGRSKADLMNKAAAPDFVGYDPTGQWTNNKFSQSRNESDLQPEDIWGSAAFFEKFGNDWLKKFSESQRAAIAQQALKSGAVTEHKGTIDVDWNNKDLSNFVSGIQSGAIKPENYSKLRPGITQMDAVTAPGGAPSNDAAMAAQRAAMAAQEKSFDAALSASVGAAQSQAAAAAKAARKQDVLQMASQPVNTPQVNSAPIKTGVATLDSILGGVLG